ncbi:hypothetical protein EDD53_2118 [Pacificibacter maritimus]|uniref:Uncharacterized protein n=1 Tax=Pacificibacter maritimus TaxID=762213 RepID=A0A3N4U6M2_9RHOB|nr:hypothetical protein [Pacificibacter maritimus]RPE66416.1 hypothetical protein EDD53_2118 [Pacificibacter maritimus]
MTNPYERFEAAKRGAKFAIPPYAERIGWEMYLLWVNGIIMFAGFGGFALFISLTDGEPFSVYGIFLGSFLAGLTALVFLGVHVISRRKKKVALIVDENTVTVSVGERRFNFGMLDLMLWQEDFEHVKGFAAKRKRPIRMLIAYRIGNHFEEGERQLITFVGYSTPAKMAELQKWYRQTMYIVKSRRKFQRDNQDVRNKAAAAEDVATLVELVGRLKSPSVINEADVLNSTDPEDRIYMLFPEVEKSRGDIAVENVIKVLNSKPLRVVTSVWYGFIGIVMSLFNAAIIFALLS